MIEASPHFHPKRDADKARRIAVEHQDQAHFTGPRRHLRRVAEILEGDPDVSVLLGSDGPAPEDDETPADQGTTHLVVSPADDAAWSAPRDHV